MAKGTTSEGRQALPTTQAPAGGTGDQALAIALQPVAFGEGARIGILGDSGTGKTHVACDLIAAYLAASPGIVVVIDGKPGRSRFFGQERRDLADLQAHPLANEPRVLVFRGDPPNVDPDVEAIAAFCWGIVKRRPVMLVIDELRDATAARKPGHRWISRVADAFTKGRSSRFSVAWGSQSPQDCPREAFEQSSVILCSKLAGKGLRYLRELDYLDGGADDVLPNLPGDDAPPNKRGVFLALRRGRPWDGRRYKF